MFLPVIMAGVYGRFLAQPTLKIFTACQYNSMLQDTVLRLKGTQHAAPMVICNEDNRFMVAEQLRAIAQLKSPVILEPVGRNTAHAIAFPCNYQPDGKTIVFIGNMTTVQNLDAARWFAKSVMPELIKHGNYQFKVIGRIKEQTKDEFNRYTNTVATGGVESVAVAAKGAIAGVCPMRLGAGVQNKVLEYMALGMPAITSSVGLEGIEAKVGEELLVADKVTDYVDLIIKISNDIYWSQTLGLKGHEYVKKAHTWQGKLSPLLDNINKFI